MNWQLSALENRWNWHQKKIVVGVKMPEKR